MTAPPEQPGGNLPEQLSFLPKPAFNPIWPKPDTLQAICLSRMLAGESITHPAFDKETGSWRLAAVVYTLKALGWPVESREIQCPTLENPARYISSYYLPEKIIVETFSNTDGGNHVQ